MKKIIAKIIILLTICLCLLTTGFGGKKNIGQIHLLFDGKEVFSEVMQIDYIKYLEVKILYRGNLSRHYQKSQIGSPFDYLGSLDNAFSEKISDTLQQFECEAIEHSAFYEGKGKFTYQHGKEGLKCDGNKLADTIIQNFSDNMVISIPYRVINPKEEYKNVVERTKKLATFTTDYRSSSENRKKNIALAVERLNNAQILSGQTISFNQAVGARTEENGFLMAKIIKNGEFIAGVGGGVCQVSTTLYNAWLMAGLEVEKSNTHSLPVRYIPPSLDAMVTSESDLVLKNKSPYPIYLYAHCDDSKLTMELFGNSCGYEIKLRSVKIRDIETSEYEIIEPYPIPEGADFEYRIEKNPVNGILSESYRDYFLEGKLVFSERLRRSVYAPQKEIKSKIIFSVEE